mgnify:CR=1 FL=1
MSDERDYFEEGRQAYMDGTPFSQRPKGLLDEQEADWEAGWTDAQEEDL